MFRPPIVDLVVYGDGEALFFYFFLFERIIDISLVMALSVGPEGGDAVTEGGKCVNKILII